MIIAPLTFFVRLALIVALAVGLTAASTISVATTPPVFADGEEDDGKGEGDEDEDDRAANDDKADKDKGKDRADISSVGDYQVEVECEFDDLGDSTTCEFAAPTPVGAKKVTHITIPDENVCTSVEGGNTEFRDPDPTTRVTGYTTRGGDRTLTLVLHGEVTVAGQSIYWIKSEGSVMPATGDGLVCTESDAKAEITQPPLTPTAVQLTPEVSDAAGAIVVQTYSCPIAEAPTEYDWFAECDLSSGGLRFRIALVEDQSATGKTGATDDAGEVRFGNLAPGQYVLTQTDGDWCHAKSDGVDADGNVIVSAGSQTTVWVFACAATPVTPTPTT